MGILNDLHDGYNNLHTAINETLYTSYDVYWIDDNLQVQLDLAGFDAANIEVQLNNNILSVKATRDSIKDILANQGKEITIYLKHRPLKIHTHIILPFITNDKDEVHPKVMKSDMPFENGILKVTITDLPQNTIHNPTSPQTSA